MSEKKEKQRDEGKLTEPKIAAIQNKLLVV
jgi:hypothetical protein